MAHRKWQFIKVQRETPCQGEPKRDFGCWTLIVSLGRKKGPNKGLDLDGSLEQCVI